MARVWLWPLDAPAPAAESLLSPDERRRAGRFYFDQDRRHFIAARAGLRVLVGAQTGQTPQAVQFQYAAHGKPSLANGDKSLCFNLSHSAGVAIAALTRVGEVGVDIEAVRPSHWAGGIARRYFSPAEIAALAAAPPERQDEAFFRLWTNKEAIVKLLGAGLSFPLPSFSTPLGVDHGDWVELPKANPLGIDSCWLCTLGTSARAPSAVACAGRPDVVELRQLELTNCFQ